MRGYSDAEIAAVREACKTCTSGAEIARKLNMSKSGVNAVLRKHGLEPSGRFFGAETAAAPALQGVVTIGHKVYESARGEPWYGKNNKVIYDDDDVLYLEKMPDDVMAMACLQIPLEHRDMLTFGEMIKLRINPDLVVLGGDILDMTFAKFSGPNSLSPNQEIEKGREAIRELARIFPQAIILTSNHVEDRIAYAAKQGNLPDVFIRQWRDVYQIPETWKIVNYLVAGKFVFEHGHGVCKGAKSSIREQTVCRFRQFDLRGMSIVRAHRHTLSGPIVGYEWESQTFCRSIHYMGCGMDAKKVDYNRAGLWNTLLHIDKGAVRPYPMEIGMDNRWTQRIVNALTGEYC